MTRHALSTRVLLIFGLIAFLLTGCTNTNTGQTQAAKQNEKPPAASRQQASHSQGGELVIAAMEQLPVFDPFGVSKRETHLHDLERITYQGLFTQGSDQSLEPSLATGYTIDRTKPKPAVVVTLRKGAVWPDGKPVTVEDVLFTYQEYARPYYYGVWRKWSHLLDGVSPFRTGKAAAISGITVDRQQGTIRFSLSRDDVSFLQSLTVPLLPKHQLAGKTTGEIDALSKTGKLLGAGPFQVDSLTPREWTLVANSSFYGSKPRLNSIRVIPLAQAKLEEELKAGRVHVSWLSPELASKLAQVENGRIVSAAAKGYHFLGYNLQSPALQDITIRKALAQAISPGQISKDSLYGWADPVKSPLAPGSFAYEPGEWPAFQPDAAAKAFAQKGYTKEKPLPLAFVYPANNQVRERLARELSKALEQLPVRLEKKALPPDQFVSYLFGGSKVDLYLYAWEYPADPVELNRLWHSREKVGERGFNASRYVNPEADQLLEKAQRLLPASERKPLYGAWQKQFSQDLPIYPLVQVRNPYFVSAQVHGVPDQLGIDPLNSIEEWWIE